jgi:glycine cleavage system H protein
VQLEGEAATVGLTDFAQAELGDIVFVELPEQARQVQKGDVLGTVESVKAVSEIYAPVSGTVLAVNEALNDQPELLNRDPHGSGWYCKLRPSERRELEGLLDAEGYAQWIGK